MTLPSFWNYTNIFTFNYFYPKDRFNILPFYPKIETRILKKPAPGKTATLKCQELEPDFVIQWYLKKASPKTTKTFLTVTENADELWIKSNESLPLQFLIATFS